MLYSNDPLALSYPLTITSYLSIPNFLIAGTTGVQKLAKDLKERVEADYPNVSAELSESLFQSSSLSCFRNFIETLSSSE